VGERRPDASGSGRGVDWSIASPKKGGELTFNWGKQVLKKKKKKKITANLAGTEGGDCPLA